ncbi:hypothetical protein C2857_003780 [Epichloe festucae Fl1]|uniref:Zn(2)-C6 fungal-type domain-containing protein n=1 Tax=Epichloe festucae (strain Fl1) TaxID=877507 RepID=A0A7S9KKJ9_EPIFF|nr:hypothetical protein C2857_003780 [Epichloe festucae Fl1]
MTQAVKRACDACHRRKVKCDGINPCRNCSSAQLSCTYNAIPQKKGPKGSRAKVISELRETQRQTSLSAKVQNRMNGIACPPIGASLAPTPGLVTSELVKECAQFFFDNLYPQAPILDRRQIEQQVLYMEQNRDAYCLMTSLCAFVMLQPGMSMPTGDPYNLDMVPGANIVSSQLLLEECLRVRKGYEYLDTITLNALATNFFLFGCYSGQEMHDKAWYHLREATTMVHMAGMNKEEHYMQFDAAEAARRRRLYWLIFSTERAYAIQRQRPVSLQATINPPTLGDDASDSQAHQLNSFITLVNMFQPFDDAFTAAWNKTRGQLTSQYLSGLQKQLNGLVQTYACQDSNFQDLHTNQQWLKNTVWQLTSGVVNGNNDNSMSSFRYPVNMSRELLVNMASQFPVQVVDLLGSGLIEKLMEMSSSMTEYLASQPASRDPFAAGPREHLHQILAMVAVARNGDYRFLPLLMNKLGEVLPRMTNPMLQDAPENANLANIDIFDGFGTAGMAHPPSQMHMSMDSDYERKFSVEEYDEKYAMSMTGNTPESATNSNHSNGSPSVGQQGTSDMGSSFVSSPSIMSPGMEYSHSMNGFIPDMVMNPMGNPGPPSSMPQGQHMGHDGMSQRMNAIGSHNMRPQGLSVMTSLGGMNQAQQGQDGFHMQGQPHMRGFQNLQRTSPGGGGSSMVGINSMGTY